MPAPDVFLDDTIFAAATPPGNGALALVRVSGPRALALVSSLPGAPGAWRHGRARHLRLTGLDDLVATAFLAPRSYTGEDTVELTCHGSRLIVDRLLAALESAGGRPAGPGEFTFRAVRHGKLTVAEAERLAHRLQARLPWELELAETGEDARGAFADLLARVNAARADLESAIEFGEGDGPDWEALAWPIRSLASQARLQERWTRLPRVLLVGPVNAGKSTLLNRLSGFDRAIVSDRPGTTRDWLEVELRHDGVPFLLIDSAGLRVTDDPSDAEAEGQRRTRALADDADVLVAFRTLDGPDPAATLGDDAGDRTIPVLGKADVTPAIPGFWPVSGRTGAGVLELLDRVVGLLRARRDRPPRWWFPARLVALALELESDWDRLLAEPLAEVRAWRLGELASRLEDQLEVPPADLYELIFSRFCIGK